MKTSVGVDGCKAGWFAVTVTDDGEWSHAVYESVEATLDRYFDADRILIDIPIGLVERRPEERKCDLEARRLLGKPRSASVFPVPSRAAILALTYEHAVRVNNEETGSWNTGVNSEWFSTLVSEMIQVQSGAFSDLDLRHTYANTQALVSDTTTALNPVFPAPQNESLTSRLGYGMVVKEYGAGREANSEFFAVLRRLLDDAGVKWQIHSYDAGYGGGTIAAWFAGQNMDVIDVGIGIVSMHSPYEVSSKVDLWELYQGFLAFFQQ